MQNREVVITGMGLISPLGLTVRENWENLVARKTGITHYPKAGVPKSMEYLGKVAPFENPDAIPHKIAGQMKFLNRGAFLGFMSAKEALANSGVTLTDIPPGRRALYIASGDFTKVGYDFMYPAMKDATNGKWKNIDRERLNISTLNKVNPFFLLEALSNNLFSFLSAFLEFMGPSTSLASLSPCGGYALELAYRSIKCNKADIAVAVGCGNWITEIPLYEIESLGILSACKDGAGSFRPFDRKRDGFITGEGGAAILLESSDTALRRGGRILGKLKGVGNCIEPPEGQGLGVPLRVTRRCMELAIEKADCSTDDLAFIIPHGSGTMKGDRSELRSVMDILRNAKDMPISGMKPYTGHLGAASDLAEIIFGIKSLKNRMAPATLNFRESEKEFADLRISESHQTCKNDHFLSVSYGIGGQSSSAVVEVL
ncbi:MAG: beta-ketoacyl-[acyl-carrier-protein] synthase family protein [Dissulfurispiraceae bacterium]